MTFTWSKVKVKVSDLKFRKLHFSSLPLLFWHGAHNWWVITDYDNMGPSLQLFRGAFLNFSPSWQSRDFRVCKILISPESTAVYLRPGRSWKLVTVIAGRRQQAMHACDDDCQLPFLFLFNSVIFTPDGIKTVTLRWWQRAVCSWLWGGAACSITSRSGQNCLLVWATAGHLRMYTVSPLLVHAVMSCYFVRMRNWGSRELLGWDVAEPVVRKSPEAQSFLAFGCPVERVNMLPLWYFAGC